MKRASKCLAIAETKVTLEYNKNIASRDKSDPAFKVHYLTWISGIRRENLKTDPMNDNSVQQICNDMFWQAKKIIHKKVGFWKRIANSFIMEINQKGEINGL